jgi:hypothetical protein
MNRGGEVNDPAGSKLGSALFLIETDVPGRGARRTRLFGAGGALPGENGEQQVGSKGESYHGSHDMCLRPAAVNPPTATRSVRRRSRASYQTRVINRSQLHGPWTISPLSGAHNHLNLFNLLLSATDLKSWIGTKYGPSERPL